MVLSEEAGVESTVATGNAVLAAIAAADAICCAAAGERSRGQDHSAASDLLRRVTGDDSLASLLDDALDLKDAGHYGLDNVKQANAQRALRKAAQLVAAARQRVR